MCKMLRLRQVFGIIILFLSICDLEYAQIIQNNTNVDPEILQNNALENELTVEEKIILTNKSDLVNKLIDSKSERHLVIQQETQNNNKNTKLGDDRILAILTEALNAIKTPKCYKDLNYTIDAIRQQKPWAIASKFHVFFCKN